MKIMTIAGTRPDLIRLSQVIKKLDEFFDHVFVHTGQNFDIDLHDKFFIDLNLRRPDYQLNLTEKLIGFEFIGSMIPGVAKIIDKERPDKILILGDVNSALSAYVAKQMHIPVYHMEAGNRCYDDAVPEEVNRRIVDSCSDFLLTYTQRSKENLLLEGYPAERIIVIGNPITEVLAKQYQLSVDEQCDLLKKYSFTAKQFIVVTIHRTENVTNKKVLTNIIDAVNDISNKNPVILSMHPKLVSMIARHNIAISDNIIQSKPLGFQDFICLVKNAKVVLTDSGTLPEESCILGTPSVLIRTSTERPELLENDSMILCGVERNNIINAYHVACKLNSGKMPIDYLDINVSDKIVKILCR